MCVRKEVMIREWKECVVYGRLEVSGRETRGRVPGRETQGGGDKHWDLNICGEWGVNKA